MRVVDAIAEWFEAAGFTHYFGYAGGALWPFLDALIDHPELEGIQAKHESHAVHMADVYYRDDRADRPGPGHQGPGPAERRRREWPARCTTRLPLMVFTGAGSTHLMGKGGMQELYYNGFEDAVSVLRPITKGSWMLMRPDTVIDILNQAYKTAVTGTPGPVFIQIPFDIQLAPVEGTPEPPRAGASPRPGRGADAAAIERSAELLRGAQRPVIVAGGGCRLSAGAPALLASLAETAQVPVATTLTAKGVFPESHDLSLGVVGRSGTDSAAAATRNADVILAVGARFSDNHTSNWRRSWSTTSRDQDHPCQRGRQRDRPELPGRGGRRRRRGQLPRGPRPPRSARPAVGDHQAWLAQVAGWKRTWTDKIHDVMHRPEQPDPPGPAVLRSRRGDSGRQRPGPASTSAT